MSPNLFNGVYKTEHIRRRGPWRGLDDVELATTRGRPANQQHGAGRRSHRARRRCQNFSAAAPNRLWVADLTWVATWSQFAYVTFVMDVFSRRIVGWRCSTNLRADLALDALKGADRGVRAAAVAAGAAHARRITIRSAAVADGHTAAVRTLAGAA